MRISAAAKQQTRARILTAARELFGAEGFGAATTRDVATAAGIATGTLFNYFTSKESLGMTLVAEALEGAQADFAAKRRGDESLEEDLFAHVMAGLHRLLPHRAWVGAVLETACTPLGTSPACVEGAAVQEAHLTQVSDLIASHRGGATPSFVSLHLYWTLYLGLLSFWSRDETSRPGQHGEQALVLIDRSLRLFVASLDGADGQSAADATQGAAP